MKSTKWSSESRNRVSRAKAKTAVAMPVITRLDQMPLLRHPHTSSRSTIRRTRRGLFRGRLDALVGAGGKIVLLVVVGAIRAAPQPALVREHPVCTVPSELSKSKRVYAAVDWGHVTQLGSCR